MDISADERRIISDTNFVGRRKKYVKREKAGIDWQHR